MMTMFGKKTLITSNDPKGLHFVNNICRTAYDKSKLDDDSAQRLNENGDEVKAAMMKIISEFSVSNQFANEEVDSSYVYPKEYSMQPITEQVRIIAKLFNLSPDDALVYADTLTTNVPEGAEGWFAIPRWEKIAPTYGEAVENVLAKIDSSRKFKNYRKGQLHSRFLKLHTRTASMLQKIGETQTGDILILPAQFALKHRGKSIRRARETFGNNEFGLGSFMIGCMLLTHPDRMVRWEELDIDCAGDEYSPDGDGDFSKSLRFYFSGGEVRFGSRGVGSAFGGYGSCSGFLPQ